MDETRDSAPAGGSADSPPTVLVIDDDPASVGALLECLRRESFRVLVAQDGTSGIERAEYARPDLILLDVMMPDMNGYETCRRLKSSVDTAQIPVIFLSALSDTYEKLEGFTVGAVDYLTKPFQYEEVLARVRAQLRLRQYEHALAQANRQLESKVEERTAELQTALSELGRLKERIEAENVYLQQEVGAEHGTIIGSSPALAAVLEKVRRVAPSGTSVLISGETGTGKELIARAIHEASPRRDRAMVKLNCAAISAGLVESELFGHIKGAFTGAVDKRVGRFELADGGTLFLDEVTELPLETQVKLLRVLQEREFEAVGSSKTRSVDVRIIAATNRQLENEIAAGRFRSDLYYRLNVFPIEVPPLRERPEDIAELAQHFATRLIRKLGRSACRIDSETLRVLQSHDWPGNVRELQNTIERAMLLSAGQWLRIDWPLSRNAAGPGDAAHRSAAWVADAGQGLAAGTPAESASNSERADSLVAVERQHIVAILRRTGGVIEGPKGAAKLLDMKPSTTRYRIKKLGIRKSDYLG
jgi:formate hydrogenlyase transcriptional activator